jgi:hypothetical protein
MIPQRVLVVAAATVMLAQAIPVDADPCRSVGGKTRLPSPDGARELLLYFRVCGDETSGEVEISSKGAPVPDRPGNVDVPGHPLRVSSRWTSNDAVVIAIPGKGSPPRPLRVDGVTITFAWIAE